MTATNHALTGAVIALAIKQPAAAIPLAFLSHFVVDMIPHYNPRGVKGFNKMRVKLKQRSFRYIFAGDMLLWPALLICLPLFLKTDISPWTLFFSMLAAVSPDFVDGLYFLSGLLGKKITHATWFDKFCIAIQRYEKPPGLIIEVAWAGLMAWLISTMASL